MKLMGVFTMNTAQDHQKCNQKKKSCSTQPVFTESKRTERVSTGLRRRFAVHVMKRKVTERSPSSPHKLAPPKVVGRQKGGDHTWKNKQDLVLEVTKGAPWTRKSCRHDKITWIVEDQKDELE